MYADHVPPINAAMRASPRTFARGVLFAVLSARVQFPRVRDQLREVTRVGRGAAALWGWKQQSFDYLETHAAQLQRDVLAADTTADALARLCEVPGLGIVKGAFVLQFLGHDIACLDTRNAQREGLDPREWQAHGRKHNKIFRQKIEAYCAATHGRAAELWNAWCEEVGSIYGEDPDTISSWHLAIVPRGFLKQWQGREAVPL